MTPVTNKTLTNKRQGNKLPNLCPMKPAINGTKIVKTQTVINIYPICVTEIPKDSPIFAEKENIPAWAKNIRAVPNIAIHPETPL